MFYIFDLNLCCGERCVDYVEDTEDNGKYRPPIDGFLAFVSFIGSVWLFIGLLIMTAGVSLTDGLMVWIGVLLEAKIFLFILYHNFATKFTAKNKIKICCCPCPWPTYKETYPGSKYDKPRPDINGKFIWEDGYVPYPSLLSNVKAKLCGGASTQPQEKATEMKNPVNSA